MILDMYVSLYVELKIETVSAQVAKFTFFYVVYMKLL